MNWYVQNAMNGGTKKDYSCSGAEYLRGFKLVPPDESIGPCASLGNGQSVKYTINLKETLPGSCDKPQNY